MKLKIRKGKEKDFPALLSLLHDEAIFEGSPKSAVKNSVEQMKKEKKYINFFIAEEKGNVIGVAVYSFAYYPWVGKSFYIEDLFVKPEYRSMGVGTKLLIKLFQFAQKEGCNRLRWEVEEKNIGAQKFYSKLGAKMGDKWFDCDLDQKGIKSFIKNNTDKA